MREYCEKINECCLSSSVIICYDSSRKFIQLMSTKAGFLNDQYNRQIPRKINQEKKKKKHKVPIGKTKEGTLPQII